MKFFSDTIAVIKGTLLDLERKHLHLAAAGLAYYFLLSFLPGLVLLTAVVAYLPVQNGTQVATSFLRNVVPQLQTPLIEDMLTTVGSHRGGLLSFGIVSSLWLTSKGVKGIIAGLDMVYEVERPRRVWTNRVLAFGLAFAVGVLLLLGVALTLAGPVVESLLSRMISVQSIWVRVWPYIQWSVAAVSTFAAIELLYLLAPNVPLKQRVTVPGALVAASIWMALSWGIGIFFQYFGAAKLDRVYGAMATPIALAIWLNWGALGMLTGAEINLSIQTIRPTKKKPHLEPVKPSSAA
ncbi:MAG: YihY/virulence factor BrkB family protein [Terracidiphilus sp.]